MAAPAADAPEFSDDERNSAPDEDELVAEKEILNEDVPDEEEADGEDLMDNLEKDYAPDEILDKYDEEQLDNRKFPEMNARDRLRAEQEMRRRDRVERARALRTPAALAIGDDDDEDKRAEMRPHRRRRREEEPAPRPEGGPEEEVPDEEMVMPIDVSQSDGMRKQLQIDSTRVAVARKFSRFLSTYTDAEKKGGPIYVERIKNMCAANRESLEVSYKHLSKCEDTTLALWLAEAPSEMLKIFDEQAMKLVLQLFKEYHNIHKEIHVRITDFGVIDQLRAIRQVHLDAMVRVPGVVTRRTGVFPHLKHVKYDCMRCEETLGPYAQTLEQEVKRLVCPRCANTRFTVNVEQTVYRNYQRITLQESPGSVPAGRLPRTKEVILLGDLIDLARPGEEVEVTGIYRNNFDSSLNHLHGFPVFATVIEANYISKKDDALASFRLSEEDEKVIRKVSKDENVADKIIRSIAPSIFGHENIKLGLALALFGADEFVVEDGQHKTRGDINILLLGDPGTAKSQFLKYLEKTCHRAVYATGQGASAVGLTAAVHKDPVTREWTLEGGALVLADKGMCLIDEFDKMNDKDRTSIHEAMEQQSISITKAGIVATLQARCSVVAAANPLRGRYDSSLSLTQNVDLTEPILSRFDILCVVRDHIDPVADEQLANFVVSSHIRSHPENRDANTQNEREEAYSPDADHLPQALLRKYIVYARSRCHPKFMGVQREKFKSLYVDLRRETDSVGGGLPIGVRHLEAMIRMSCAHARIHLRDSVNEEDVNVAIRVMLESFIQAQKLSVAKTLQRKFNVYITYKKDSEQLLYYLLQQMVREAVQYKQIKSNRKAPVNDQDVEVVAAEFEARAHAQEITEVKSFYTSKLFTANKFELDAKTGVIRKKF